MKLHQDCVNRPGGAMGAVIMFPRARRRSCETPTPNVSAAVVILPAIRIERMYDEPPATERKATRSPSGRKRRKRAARRNGTGKAGVVGHPESSWRSALRDARLSYGFWPGTMVPDICSQPCPPARQLTPNSLPKPLILPIATAFGPVLDSIRHFSFVTAEVFTHCALTDEIRQCAGAL
jgi:hypothetical protein